MRRVAIQICASHAGGEHMFRKRHEKMLRESEQCVSIAVRYAKIARNLPQVRQSGVRMTADT